MASHTPCNGLDSKGQPEWQLSVVFWSLGSLSGGIPKAGHCKGPPGETPPEQENPPEGLCLYEVCLGPEFLGLDDAARDHGQRKQRAHAIKEQLERVQLSVQARAKADPPGEDKQVARAEVVGAMVSAVGLEAAIQLDTAGNAIHRGWKNVGAIGDDSDRACESLLAHARAPAMREPHAP